MPRGLKTNSGQRALYRCSGSAAIPKAEVERRTETLRHREARDQSTNLRAHRGARDKAREHRGNAEAEVGMSGNMIGTNWMKELIWGAGAGQVGIVLANVPLV